MKNLNNIITLIKEDEEQKELNIRKFIDKQLKKNRDIINGIKYFDSIDEDILENFIKEVYEISYMSYSMFSSQMVSLVFNSMLNNEHKNINEMVNFYEKLLIVAPTYFDSYLKILNDKSNFLEYSVPIKKLQQFNNFTEFLNWLKDSRTLLKDRIKQREIKRRDKSDLKWGDYLIFKNKQIGDAHFDCYLFTNFKTAKEQLSGFAKWCWTKSPSYWDSYTGSSLLFLLENKDIKDFKIQSPPKVETQEKLIACHCMPFGYDKWGEINHLNNSESNYSYDIKYDENITNLFIDGFEEATGLDINDFPEVYSYGNKDKEEKIDLNNVFDDFSIEGNKLIINGNIKIGTPAFNPFEEDPDYELYCDELRNILYNYKIYFMGDEVTVSLPELRFVIDKAVNINLLNIMGGGHIIIGEVRNIREITTSPDSTAQIINANNIDTIKNYGITRLGSGVKRVGSVEKNGISSELYFIGDTYIGKINLNNVSKIKTSGDGIIAIGVKSKSEIYIAVGNDTEVEVYYKNLNIELNRVRNVDLFMGDITLMPEAKSKLNEINISKEIGSLTTILSMALEDKIKVNDLEKLVKESKIILLNDIDESYDIYEYNENDWKNDKFTIEEE